MLDNTREVITGAYWVASSAWHGRNIDNTGWNVGMLINELSSISWYRGLVGVLANRTLDDVVNDNFTLQEAPAEVFDFLVAKAQYAVDSVCSAQQSISLSA